MGLFSFLFGSGEAFPYDKQFTFQPSKKSIKHVTENSKLNPWSNPKSRNAEVKLYLPKTYAGEGYVGQIHNYRIWKHLENNDAVVNVTVLKINDQTIKIRILCRKQK